MTMPTAADFAEARMQDKNFPQAERNAWANKFGAALEGTMKWGFYRQGLDGGDQINLVTQEELRALVHYVASIASRATVMACERENTKRSRNIVESIKGDCWLPVILAVIWGYLWL